MNASEGTLICIAGTAGGCGTSSLAAALAAAIQASAGSCVLVDLDLCGAGVDVLLGIESEPGARWPDLTAARGEVDGRGLLGALPHWAQVPVVSGARLSAQLPPEDVVLDVCAGLLRAGQTVVADLPRPNGWSAAVRALLVDADFVFVVAPLCLKGSAGAQALLAMMRRQEVRSNRGPQVGLVGVKVPGGQVVVAELGELLDVDVVAKMRFDRHANRTVEHGLGPNVGRRSQLGQAAYRLVARIRAER